MKIRLRKPDNSQSRAHPSNLDETLPKTQTLSYRSRRSDEEHNKGRRADRKQENNNPRLNRGRFLLQKLGLIVLLLAVIVSGFNILKLSSTADIVPASSGNDSSSLVFNKNAYEAKADQLLAASTWNHNKITVDTAQIKRQLSAQFPDIASVSITIPILTHNLIIYIELAQFSMVIKSPSSGAYVLNENGKAVLNDTGLIANQQSGLPVVTDLSGLKLALGNQVLPNNNVSFIQNVVKQLSLKNYEVTSMTLPPAASELDVSLAGKPYIIKFNLENNDPRQQTGTFLATMAQLQSQNITPAKYVDVRVDGRAYYQ